MICKFTKISIAAFFLLTFKLINASTAQFLVYSDIHFDPFFTCSTDATQCPLIDELVKIPSTDPNWQAKWDEAFKRLDNDVLPTYGQDTNYALLKSALAEVQRLCLKEHPKFILILGDYFGHNLRENFTKYTGKTSAVDYDEFLNQLLGFLFDKMQTANSGIPSYPAIGNNDSDNGDYYTLVNGMFLKKFTELWKPVVKPANNQASFTSTTKIAGFYEVTIPDEPSHKIIVLNSVPFYYSAKGDSSKASSIELKWFAERLNTLKNKNQRAMIVMHISPGILVSQFGPHASEMSTRNGKSLWLEKYVNPYHQLLVQYEHYISAQLSAHQHKDFFKLFNYGKRVIIDSVQGSFSPSYANNPSVKIYRYNTNTLVLQDFTVYYLPLETKPMALEKARWREEYNFNDIYQPHCRDCNLENGMLKLKEQKKLVQKYMQYFFSLSSEPYAMKTFSTHWAQYWCETFNETPSSFKNCLKSWFDKHPNETYAK